MKEFFNRNIIAFILIVAAVVYLLSMNVTEAGQIGDDAIYITCSRAIVTGQGCRQIETVGAPRGSYPPGFPLMIAPLVALTYPGIHFLKLFAVLMSLATVYMVYKYLRDNYSLGIASCVALLLALNPVFIEFSGTIMSDIPFIFFIFLTLHLWEKEEERTDFNLPRVIGISLVLSACFWIRVQGILLFIALFVILALRRDFRRLVTASVAFLVTSIPLFIYTGFASHYGSRSGEALALLPSLAQIILKNISFYVSGNFFLFSFPHISPVSGILLCLPVIYGFYGLVRERKGGIQGLFSFLFLGSLLIYHFFCARYFLPLIPFFYLFLFHAITKIRLESHRNTTKLAVVILILVLNAPQDFQTMKVSLGKGFADAPFPETTRWVSQNIRKDTIIMSNIAPLLFIETGIRGVEFIPEVKPYNRLMQIYRNHVGYLLFTPLVAQPSHLNLQSNKDFSSIYYFRTITDNGQKFRRLYDNPGEETVLFQVLDDGASFIQAYRSLGEAYELYGGGRLDPASDALSRCLKLEPDFFEALLLKARILLEKGSFEDSEAILLELVRRDPLSIEAHIFLGQAYGKQGRKEQAVSELDRAYGIASGQGDSGMLELIGQLRKDL